MKREEQLLRQLHNEVYILYVEFTGLYAQHVEGLAPDRLLRVAVEKAGWFCKLIDEAAQLVGAQQGQEAEARES